MSRLSFTQPADFFKERDFGQKIEASFDFVRAHFRPFGKCLLYIVLPAALLSGISAGLMQSRMQTYMRELQVVQQTGSSPVAAFTDFLGSPEYLLTFVAGLFTLTLLILTTYGYLILCLNRTDGTAEIEVSAVWALVRRRFVGTLLANFGLVAVVVAACVPMMGVALLMQVAGPFIGVLFPVFYLGLIYVIFALSLFHIIWVREELGFFATLRRCFYLIWGKWWSTFGLLFVMGMIIGIMSIVFFIPQSFLNVSTLLTPSSTPPDSLLVVATNTLSSMALIMLYPLLFLAIAFQYFNLVERKEGEGLRTLVGRIGQPAVAQPYAADRYRADEEGEY